MACGAFLFLLALACFAFGGSAAAQSHKPASAKKPAAKSSAAKPQSKKRTATRRRRARGQMTPTAARIGQIQAALVQAGLYSGEPTGKWDAATVAAVKNFQQEKGLRVTGKLNARTLQMLGMGSETAGLAPPRKAVAADSGVSQ